MEWTAFFCGMGLVLTIAFLKEGTYGWAAFSAVCAGFQAYRWLGA